MDVSMKISIVIPTKNEEENLPHLLESIKNQNFPRDEVEIIVVDSNSADNTVKIAKCYDTRVLTENRLGIPYARDTGARVAKGEIIVGTCADCIWPATHLQGIYNAFKKNQKLFGLFGLIYMPDAPLAIRVGMKIAGFYGHYMSKLLGRSPVCWASNFSFRNSAFKKVGGYNLDLPLLRMGINAHASDEYNMADRLLSAGGKTLYDKNLQIQSSGRRFRGRLTYWLLVEHLLAFVINEKMYNWFGFIIPVPSYSKKLSYDVRYNYALITVIALVFVVSSYFMTASTQYPDYVVNTAKTEMERASTMRNNLQNLSQNINFPIAISPYLEKHNPFKSLVN